MTEGQPRHIVAHTSKVNFKTSNGCLMQKTQIMHFGNNLMRNLGISHDSSLLDLSHQMLKATIRNQVTCYSSAFKRGRREAPHTNDGSDRYVDLVQ